MDVLLLTSINAEGVERFPHEAIFVSKETDDKRKNFINFSLYLVLFRPVE
jgi:hypothetical protein